MSEYICPQCGAADSVTSVVVCTTCPECYCFIRIHREGGVRAEFIRDFRSDVKIKTTKTAGLSKKQRELVREIFVRGTLVFHGERHKARTISSLKNRGLIGSVGSHVKLTPAGVKVAQRMRS
jgi:hypothetical protein